MRPRVFGTRSPLGRWCWWVEMPESLPMFFWTWEAAIDHAIELVLELKHKNHLHLWN